MNMRFKVGEMAKMVVARDSLQQAYVQQECVVERIGPFPVGTFMRHPSNPLAYGTTLLACDYIVLFADKAAGLVMDWQLQKLNPPDEPEAMRRDETIEEEALA